MGRTACTEPQCLYKGTLTFFYKVTPSYLHKVLYTHSAPHYVVNVTTVKTAGLHIYFPNIFLEIIVKLSIPCIFVQQLYL